MMQAGFTRSLRVYQDFCHDLCFQSNHLVNWWLTNKNITLIKF